MKSTAKMRLIMAIGACSALTLAGCGGGGASADGTITLHAVTMVQPNVPSAPVERWVYDQLEERSGGRITIDRTEPESLCPGQEIVQCIRDRRADIGTTISDYAQQLFPSLTVVTIPFMVENPQVLMEALYRVNRENESAVARWDEVNLRMLGAWGPGRLILGSREPVRDISDFQGVSYRVTGGFLQRAFDGGGANVVSLTAGETYEGIERGIADALAWTMDGAVDYKLMEQLSHWTDAGVGQYTTFTTLMNQDTYEALPEDLREVVDGVADDLNAGAAMEQFSTVTTPQCDAMLAHPNVESFTAWEPEATQEWKDLVQEGLIEAWIVDAESNGLSDARGYFEDYQAALADIEARGVTFTDPVSECIARFADK